MLLANRSRRVDQPTASKFMIHAEQFAIELKGESETPDSNEMIQGAERIQRIIQAFDKRLCVKLVAAKDIGEEELDAAAKACGFVKESDRYQRYVPGISTAVFHILPPQTLGNEIELSFEVPLMAPASPEPVLCDCQRSVLPDRCRDDGCFGQSDRLACCKPHRVGSQGHAQHHGRARRSRRFPPCLPDFLG